MTSPNCGPTPLPLKRWEEQDPEGRQHVQDQRWLVSEARMKIPVSQLLVQGLSYCTTPKNFFFFNQKPNKARQNKSFLFCPPANWLSYFGHCLHPHCPSCRGTEFMFGFSYRFVITRPENEFSLLPSDLVFCAIPFSTSCYKKDSKKRNAELNPRLNMNSLLYQSDVLFFSILSLKQLYNRVVLWGF